MNMLAVNRIGGGRKEMNGVAGEVVLARWTAGVLPEGNAHLRGTVATARPVLLSRHGFGGSGVRPHPAHTYFQEGHMGDLVFTIPIRTYSEANLREHWRTCAKRTAHQRFAARLITAEAIGWNRNGGGGIITITRIAPRIMDTDNLARSMKAIRDGVADALGVDDGSTLLTWRYDQKTGVAKMYAVEVRIEGRGG